MNPRGKKEIFPPYFRKEKSMTNNNEDKMKTEGNDSLLKYSAGTSYTSRSSPVSGSERPVTLESDNQPPAQFESRRARRASETSAMQQVPVPVKTPLQEAPVVSVPQTNYYSSPAQASTVSEAFKAIKLEKPAKTSKEYWGGTAMLTSLSIFLLAQVVAAIVVIVHIMLNPDMMRGLQQGSLNVEKVMTETPALLIFGNVLMYAAWLGCMWWVTKYRSGVQRGKKFWIAFKDNFRLNVFKWRDIAYGAGIAAGLLGLQYLVLTVLPELIPSLKPVLDQADNTGAFKNMDGLSFYLIAFGMGGVLGPIVEELFFRGFLLRGFENHFSYKNSGRNMDILEDGLGEHVGGVKSMFVTYRSFTHKYRYVLAVIATSILFGLMHFQGTSWITVIMTGTLGLVLGIVTLKTNRLYPAIVGHIIHNSAVFLVLALNK
jgi:membrane protease YdiL (CAAX protease family)